MCVILRTVIIHTMKVILYELSQISYILPCKMDGLKIYMHFKMHHPIILLGANSQLYKLPLP